MEGLLQESSTLATIRRFFGAAGAGYLVVGLEVEGRVPEVLWSAEQTDLHKYFSPVGDVGRVVDKLRPGGFADILI